MKRKTYSPQSGQDALFGDAALPVTLVGTSYSANKLWHFEGHLKTAMQADILNMADEGQGPFATMRAWLDSGNFKSNKPRLVIWEMPERYLLRSEDQVQKDKIQKDI